MSISKIMIKVKFSKRWFFWPLFFAVKAAYKMRLISLERAAQITCKGARMELPK